MRDLIAGTRVCLLPDLDGELTAVFDRIEELLLLIRCWIEDDPDEAVLPPVGDGTALASLRRISDAARHSQSGDGPRLLAPDGRYEHVPLRPVGIDPADLAVLGATASQLRDAVGAGGWGLIAQAIEAAADGYLPVDCGEGPVNQTERLHRLLVIEPNAATRPVWTRLASASSGDVVLTGAEESAYQHLVDQVTGAWCPGNLLARWLY